MTWKPCERLTCRVIACKTLSSRKHPSLATGLTDQVMVVTHERLGQLDILQTPGHIRDPQETQAAQKVHRAIDRCQIDSLTLYPLMDLHHGKGSRRIQERIEDGSTRGGRAKAAASKQLGYSQM